MKRNLRLKVNLMAEEYVSPQCQVIQLQIENVLCQSLPGDNIGGWESGNGDGEDIDSDL